MTLHQNPGENWRQSSRTKFRTPDEVSGQIKLVIKMTELRGKLEGKKGRSVCVMLKTSITITVERICNKIERH